MEELSHVLHLTNSTHLMHWEGVHRYFEELMAVIYAEEWLDGHNYLEGIYRWHTWLC